MVQEVQKGIQLKAGVARMTRILIKCPNPKCNQAIPLIADAEIRIRFAPNEKAEFVHEDIEKQTRKLLEAEKKKQITSLPEKPRTNEAQWFEAVMTEWQPRELFLAVVATCKKLGMFTKSLRTLQDLYDAGMYTTIQRDAILKAYQEAKE